MQISSYHDSFFGEYTKNYDGKIILSKADKAYLELLSAKETDIGTDTRNFLPKSKNDLLKCYFEQYSGHEYSLKYINTFSGFENLLWNQKVTIKTPKITIKGTLLKNPDNTLSDSFLNNHGKGKKEIIILKKESGIYTLLNSDENNSSEIMKIFQKNIYNKDFCAYMEKLLKKRNSICGYSIFSRFGISSDKYTEIYSYKTGQSTVRIIIFSEPDHTDPLYNYSISKRIANNQVIGCASFEIFSSDHILLSETNLLMSTFIYDKKINSSSIINSAVFKNSMDQKAYRIGRINHSDGDKEYSYILGVYPVLKDANVRSASVFLIPLSGINFIYSENTSYLRPREKNILRLTAEGCTLKHIADTLHISESTVKAILSSCYKKLNVKNKTEAIIKMYGVKL